MARSRSGNVHPKVSGKHFGKRMREIRISKNLSIQKVADEVGIQRNYVSQIEKGDKIPSADTMIRIANALNVTMDPLLCDYLDAANQVIPAGIYDKIAKLPRDQQRHIERLIDLEIEFLKKQDN